MASAEKSRETPDLAASIKSARHSTNTTRAIATRSIVQTTFVFIQKSTSQTRRPCRAELPRAYRQRRCTRARQRQRQFQSLAARSRQSCERQHRSSPPQHRESPRVCSRRTIATLIEPSKRLSPETRPPEPRQLIRRWLTGQDNHYGRIQSLVFPNRFRIRVWPESTRQILHLSMGVA